MGTRVAACLMLALTFGCGGNSPRNRDWSSSSSVPVAARTERNLPSVGGFFLGAEWIREIRRCASHGVWRVDADGMSGTCSDVLVTVGYQVESVFLRRCGPRVCQITVRIPMEGETQLESALLDVMRTWSQRYGGPDAEIAPDTDAHCRSEVHEGRLTCLLRGEGMQIQSYRISSDVFTVPQGSVAQVYSVGAAGPQRATIRMTLATPDGISAARIRDL